MKISPQNEREEHSTASLGLFHGSEFKSIKRKIGEKPMRQKNPINFLTVLCVRSESEKEKWKHIISFKNFPPLFARKKQKKNHWNALRKTYFSVLYPSNKKKFQNKYPFPTNWKFPTSWRIFFFHRAAEAKELKHFPMTMEINPKVRSISHTWPSFSHRERLNMYPTLIKHSPY